MAALLKKSPSKSAHSDPQTNDKVASQLLQLRKVVEDMTTDNMSSHQHMSFLCDISSQIQQAVTLSHQKTQNFVSTEMQRLREASDSLQQVHNKHHDEQMSMLKTIFNRMEAPTQPQMSHRQQVLKGLRLSNSKISMTNTLIGKGGFGSVYMGMFNGSSVAVKATFEIGRTPDQIQQQRQAVESEVLLMHSSKHPGIIAVYGYVHSPARKASLIAMELASRGSLGDLLSTLRHDHLNSIPYSLAISWVRDIANALAFLHSNRILHRDVKPQNVLLTDNLFCKITDFGLAKEQMSSALGLPSTVGTLVFMAPEIKMNQGGNHRSDVYSLGVTTVQIFNRHTPSASDSTTKWINKALDAFHLPANISACLQTFLAGCLSFELTHRYSIEDAMRGLQGLQAQAGGDPRDPTVRHADGAQVRVLDDLARGQFDDPAAFLAAAKAKREAAEKAQRLATAEAARIKVEQEAAFALSVQQKAEQEAAEKAQRVAQKAEHDQIAAYLESAPRRYDEMRVNLGIAEKEERVTQEAEQEAIQNVCVNLKEVAKEERALKQKADECNYDYQIPKYHTGGMFDPDEERMVIDDFLETLSIVDFTATLDLGRDRGRTPDPTEPQKKTLEKLANKLFGSASKGKTGRGGGEEGREEDDSEVIC